MASRTLFDIGADLQQLYDVVNAPPDTDAAVQDAADEQLLAAWFASLQEEQAGKLDGYLNLIFQLDMEANQARSMASLFAAKAKSREEKVKWLKEKMIAYLKATGQKKVVTKNGSAIALQAAGGKQPVTLDPAFEMAIDDGDSTVIPVEFLKVTSSLDNEKVRKKLEAGELLEFAALGERATILRIRT
jgi:hypothetical protein